MAGAFSPFSAFRAFDGALRTRSASITSQIAALFAQGEQGAWYDIAPQYCYQDTAGTTPASVLMPVGKVIDRSGNGNHATQNVEASRPAFRDGGAISAESGQSVQIAFLEALGADCTIVNAVPGTGVEYQSDVTIGAGTYVLPADTAGMLIIDRELSEPEAAIVRAYMDRKARSEPLIFAADVAFIGDSRIYDSEYVWKNVSFPSGTEGLPLSVGFATDQGITSDSPGGGVIEYRAADAHVRWTAPGDSAGPWTPLGLGWLLLESGGAGKGVRVGVRSLQNLPTEDKSFSVNVTGPTQNAWNAYGFGTRMMSGLRWLNGSPKFLGLGGNTTAQLVEQLPWLAAQAGGFGYDVIHLGTNDIGGSDSLETIVANMETVFDARRAMGRRLVLIGEPARWGVDTSTPLTPERQGVLAGMNAFMAGYAMTHGEIYVDTFSITADPGHSDARPLVGVLRDRVHYSDEGAQIVGEVAAQAVAQVVGRRSQRPEGSSGNLLDSRAYMAGSSGTVGTGASGVAPTGWTVSRMSGSDATVVCGVMDRADGVAGRWMDLDIAATAGGQIIQAAISTVTLATLGLSAGDRVCIEAELQISDVSGGLVECDVFATFVGASPASSVRCQRTIGTSGRQRPESVVRQSPYMNVPAGTTGMRFFLWVRTDGSASARVRMGACGIFKTS